MHEIADIACNFTSDRFDNDLDEVIDRAIANHITKFGLICSRLRDIDKLLEIYNRYSKNMFFTIGVHPHHANEINAEYLEKLKEAVHINNPNAIGETGLDFFRNLSTYEEQIFAFEEQIKIAIDTNKPLFLHQRDSHEDFIKILRKYSSDINKICRSIKNKKFLVHALKYKNRLGNPIGFDISLIKKFKNIKGQFGAKFMVKRLKNRTNFINTSSLKSFKDFDKVSDFRS